MTISDVISILEDFAPKGYQESYDNSGLQVGTPSSQATGVLLCLDVTPETIDEAIALGANLIVSHHPVLFTGLKSITGKSYTERIVIKAISNSIAIYSAHTNLDTVWNGLNHELAKRLNLTEVQTLAPASEQLVKLITFAPHSNAQAVRNAIFAAGAGTIGDYNDCSFNTEGYGTFTPGDTTSPYVGQKGSMHTEPETRIEVIVPKPILHKAIESMCAAHPYQEVAYDIVPLLNQNPRAGIGVIGLLPEPMGYEDFLEMVKYTLRISCVRHSTPLKRPIRKVAVCGGSGGNLMGNAIGLKADAFITSDIKYQNFIEALDSILIADVGHFESEIIAVDIFYELLTKKITNFAVLKSEVSTNPINYL